MQRTQIYLTAEQIEALRALARRRGMKQSELIRDALDRYLSAAVGAGRGAILDRAAGLWKDRDDLPAYSERRAGWDRGLDG